MFQERDGDDLLHLARREGNGSGDARVVRIVPRRAVQRLVVHAGGARGGARAQDGDVGVAVGVIHGVGRLLQPDDARTRGHALVVHDGERGARGQAQHGAGGGGAELQVQGFVPVRRRIVRHAHRERLTRLPRRKGEGAAVGFVVRASRGGGVDGGEFHGRSGAHGARARHSDGGGPRVLQHPVPRRREDEGAARGIGTARGGRAATAAAPGGEPLGEGDDRAGGIPQHGAAGGVAQREVDSAAAGGPRVAEEARAHVLRSLPVLKGEHPFGGHVVRARHGRAAGERVRHRHLPLVPPRAQDAEGKGGGDVRNAEGGSSQPEGPVDGGGRRRAAGGGGRGPAGGGAGGDGTAGGCLTGRGGRGQHAVDLVAQPLEQHRHLPARHVVLGMEGTVLKALDDPLAVHLTHGFIVERTGAHVGKDGGTREGRAGARGERNARPDAEEERHEEVLVHGETRCHTKRGENEASIRER